MLVISKRQNRTPIVLISLSIGLLIIIIVALQVERDDTGLSTQAVKVSTLSITQHNETTFSKNAPRSNQNDNVKHANDVVSTVNNGRPTLLIFTPIDDNQSLIIWEASQLAQDLRVQYQNEINVINVPIQNRYIIDNANSHIAPKLYWDVELVQPYINWLPEFTLTETGWGLETTTATLIANTGQILYTGDIASIEALISKQWKSLAAVQ